jgi:DNA-binding NarL/FixJ family response regulator
MEVRKVMPEQIRVLLADDHPLVRAGLRAVLNGQPDLALVGEAADGYEAQRLSTELQPNVLLLDLHMPGPRATQIVTQLHQICPRLKVIALTAYNDDAYIRGLVSAGAAGYVLKDEAPEVIVQSIRLVARGGEWYSPSVAARLAAWLRGEEVHIDHLTTREVAVLHLLVDGKTNREIGAELSISEKTVEKHLAEIFGKLGVGSRVEAAVRSVKDGLA